MSDLNSKRDRLLQYIGRYSRCAVAFSAGVDSTVVAMAARMVLGRQAVAVTAASPSLAQGELDEARDLAARIGIRHEIIRTSEFDNPLYVENQPDRCYHCKTELYTQLAGLQEKLGVDVVFNGANLDDLGDYRPGLQAAAEHAVLSPLADCGFRKTDVRQLAADWDLPVWDKPATPCLSSRVAYGEEVSPERLAMIDRAEQFLRASGIRTVRVRYHKGDLARLEVPLDEVAGLVEPGFRNRLVEHFKGLGFKYVALDLEGFRSGSQNLVLPVESLYAAPQTPVDGDRLADENA